MHSKDSNQTKWMQKLIRVFAGHTGHFVGFVILRQLFRETIMENVSRKLLPCQYNNSWMLKSKCCWQNYIWAYAGQNQHNDLCGHRRPRSTWASAHCDQESSLCAQWVAKNPMFLHADSEDSDQSGQMPRLIWVFAVRTCHSVGFVVLRFNYIL